MARRRSLKLPTANLPSLIENTTIPLTLGGGFVSALALAVLSVSFLGDPMSGEPSSRVTIGRTSALGETATTGEPRVVTPEETPVETHTTVPAANVAAIDPSILVEEGPHGPLPVVSPEGGRVMDAFARPFDKGDTHPRISIIVTGLGLALEPSQSAIQKLPPEVTLSFVPYGADLKPLVEKARQVGHEVVLEIPMEPFDYPENDPGPYALLTQLSAEENDKRLSWILSRFTGYAGVSNYLGGQFLGNRQTLKPALVSLQTRGVYFLDTSVSPGSLGVQIAGEVSLPSRRADLVLDVVQSRESIDDQLSALERAARETGKAVGVAFIYPVTIERIAAWAPGLKEKGFALAPVSAMLEEVKPAATASHAEDRPAESPVPDQRRDDGH
jgi:polysaccharide deacetylase 2 family uncharacterized protein YibQ